ncbi:hypothetical protein L1277_000505 [Okibacterium sp. HSC-33S16]|uniref:hypothetical protein n=1 Tax=Okibacterium sp. HSC-33S16 TaxID=2910965 RepID=UPI0020A1D647|nr:hypothetical protein [Okibacterium sp. HSC-33S16]MCP2030441.1 hypothetical protein [Okibacterium sp. HSC-33S16]
MEFGVRAQQRMLRRALAVAVTSIVGVAVVGCTTPAPKPSPTPTSIFSSEDEALAAATDTYQQYTAALDAVYAGGGVDPSPLQPLVTEKYWTVLSEDRTLSDRGWRTSGVTTFDTVSVVEVALGESPVSIVTTLCKDVTAVRIVDTTGADVTPPTRRDRYPLLVTFQSAPGGAARVLVSESDPWAGDDPC